MTPCIETLINNDGQTTYYVECDRRVSMY